MLKRIVHFIRQHDWFAVIVEVLVVAIGLLLAFQLDRWREERQERLQERVYVERLTVDVTTDIPAIEHAIQLQTLRLGLIDLLIDVARDPMAAAEDPVLFIGAISQSAYTYTPTLTSHTFENLRATGDLQLLLSQDVKDSLFSYYGYDESQWQYRPLQFSTEFRHFELSAGILTMEQEIYMQDNWLFIRPDNIAEARKARPDVSEVIAAAERLQNRPELVAWLPTVRSMQLEQIAVHEDRKRLAQHALDTLQNYASEIAD